jgi:hypothetical protein
MECTAREGFDERRCRRIVGISIILEDALLSPIPD